METDAGHDFETFNGAAESSEVGECGSVEEGEVCVLCYEGKVVSAAEVVEIEFGDAVRMRDEEGGEVELFLFRVAC